MNASVFMHRKNIDENARNPLIKNEMNFKAIFFFVCTKDKLSVNSCRFHLLTLFLSLSLIRCLYSLSLCGSVSIEMSRRVFRSHFKWVTLTIGRRDVNKFQNDCISSRRMHIHILYRMMNVRGHIHLQYKHLDNTFYLSRHHVKSMFRFLQPSGSLVFMYAVLSEASLISICVQCNAMCMVFLCVSCCLLVLLFSSLSTTFTVRIQCKHPFYWSVGQIVKWHDMTVCIHVRAHKMPAEWELKKKTQKKNHKEVFRIQKMNKEHTQILSRNEMEKNRIFPSANNERMKREIIQRKIHN